MDALRMQQRAKLHPLMGVAAVAVTVFSLAGIGAIAGVIPAAGSKPAEPLVTAAAPAAQPEPAAPQPVAQPLPAAPAPVQQAAPRPAPVKHAAPRPAPVKAKYEKPLDEPYAQANPPASKTAPAPICHNCGVIESVREQRDQGEGSGLGAVAGGVLGGVLGHQVGGGRGKDLATVAGAVGGAFAGHQVEKRVRATNHYEVTVRYDDGTSQVFRQEAAPTWRNGDRVKVVNGAITASY